MRKIFVIIFAVICASIALTGQNSTNISVKAALDSAYIMMGNKTAVHIEVVGNLDGTGYFMANDSLWKDVELSGETEVTINDLGNNRKELKKDLIIQAFDSGMYTIPLIMYIQGNDTIRANEIVLKVIPVNVDSLRTIHDFADIESPGSRFFDFVPEWVADYGFWMLLGLLVIAVAIYLFIKWRKGKLSSILKSKPELPPYEAAIKALNDLKSRNLCETGQEKVYYTNLTEILRVYLSKRFGINAMEMTSQQIRQAILDNKTISATEPLIGKILEIADFVKFAKVRPLPSDNQLAYNNAVKFVEETKPVEDEIVQEKLMDDSTTYEKSI